MKTYALKTEEVSRKWYVVNAEDKILGRLATGIANVLNGKTSPEYTPNVDCGDCVVVINADKIKTTGKKMLQKEYKWYTGYPSGQKTRSMKDMFEKKPEWVLFHAVKGMLPKNRLCARKLKRLHIYSGTEHPHQAQKPEALEL